MDQSDRGVSGYDDDLFGIFVWFIFAAAFLQAHVVGWLCFVGVQLGMERG